MPHDIFATLSRYNLSSPENYLTEALCYVVRLLLEREPAVGLDVLANLCGLQGDGGLGPPDAIQVSTQVSVEVGRPDIEIRDCAGTTLVYVEVKHGSPLSPRQLEAYRRELDRSDMARTALVLLTRSVAPPSTPPLPRTSTTTSAGTRSTIGSPGPPTPTRRAPSSPPSFDASWRN